MAEAQKRTKANDHSNEDRKLLEEKQHLKKSLEQIEKINQTHEELLQEKQSHAKEIEEREKTIKDKGIRIQELKKKTQELEKFKFVLDYKIKELKREIGPREEEIAKMKEQISNMNAEITHFKRMNANMTLIVKDLVSKKKGMENELEQQNRVEMSNENYIKSFETEVSEMYQNTIGVSRLLRRTSRNSRPRCWTSSGSTCRTMTTKRRRWTPSTSRRSTSRNEPTWNQRSRASRISSRTA